jgi:hypothetical protein
MTNPQRGPGELPDYVKFQCMRQLNQELLDRLKASQEEVAKYKNLYDMLHNVLQESNGKEESLGEGLIDTEEGTREEQDVPEAQGQGQRQEEGEEVKED